MTKTAVFDGSRTIRAGGIEDSGREISACCAVEVQDVCCEPAEKSSCCGAATSTTCGCQGNAK